MLPRSGTPWSALNVHAVPLKVVSSAHTHSDMAAFMVNVNDDPQTRGLEIKTLPVAISEPAVGAECLGFGYPQQKGVLSFTMIAARGVIEEVHPRMRDSSFVTWPSFRTDASFDFGTSGGPVFDADGNVIGVVSTSFTDFSYAALTGGLMELKVDLHCANEQIRELSIGELMEMDVVATYGQAILRRDSDGVVLQWS
jgi:hypothetical protein